MAYERGDQVRVVGVDGKEAVLRVWGTVRSGLLLTTERGFVMLTEGKEAPYVGFPFRDIKEKIR